VITLKIEDEKIENIFLNEFNSNADKFFEFIQNSFDNMKNSTVKENSTSQLMQIQEKSMSKTWDSDEDEAWDEL
jgi:hypothetical protein